MEQALTFASIVLGVAVAFELSHLNTLLRSNKVKWHWAQPLFAFYVLLTIMSFWWMIASRQAEPVTLAMFLPVMWELVLLTLLAAASLPDKVPEAGLSLAQYYQDNRRYLWTLFLLAFVPLAANWIVLSALRTSSVADFIAQAGGEFVPLVFMTILLFARRWWLVAVGMAGLGFTVVTWLSRTI